MPQTSSTVMRFDGSSNFLCFFFFSQYNYDLVLSFLRYNDILDETGQVFISNPLFRITANGDAVGISVRYVPK